jgi:hypothetical protein
MPSFARDILPLFRKKDVDEMRFAFDLSVYDDVQNNASGIYASWADPCRVTAPGHRSRLSCFGSGWTRVTACSPGSPKCGPASDTRFEEV